MRMPAQWRAPAANVPGFWRVADSFTESAAGLRPVACADCRAAYRRTLIRAALTQSHTISVARVRLFRFISWYVLVGGWFLGQFVG